MEDQREAPKSLNGPRSWPDAQPTGASSNADSTLTGRMSEMAATLATVNGFAGHVP